MDSHYKDSRGRSVTAEDIALDWISRNRERALQALGRQPPTARPFVVHGKAVDGDRVQIEVREPGGA